MTYTRTMVVVVVCVCGGGGIPVLMLTMLVGCFLADEARSQLQQVLGAAQAKGVSGKELMAAAVASMDGGASADEALPKQEKLVVSVALLS